MNPSVSPQGRDRRDAPRVHHTRVRVRYAETDRMGFAYNAHYLTWFEVGRTEYMRALGLPYREVEERGYNLPLVEAGLKLRAPVRYDDRIEIETRISETRSRTVTFAYRILRTASQAKAAAGEDAIGDTAGQVKRSAGEDAASEEILAEGFTKHACVQADTGRTATLPEWLSARL